MTTKKEEEINYRDSLFLPKTDFPMRGNLTKLEPDLLDRWQRINLWQKIREQSKNNPKFTLHDGPPYANGFLHIGHGMNKALKDIVNRLRQMQGFNANFIPGWDCHGLPIEWKVEEEFRKNGREKDTIPVTEFRDACRKFANHWLEIQKNTFTRLGVAANWDKPYKTMNYDFEATIAEEIGKFVMNGSLYRGRMPVLWSVVEGTAMASAELEYQIVTSEAIFVTFKVANSSLPELEGAELVAWTTTPWTIPANRALAINKNLEYVIVTTKNGRKLVFAKKLEAQAARNMQKYALDQLETTIEDSIPDLSENFFEELAEDLANGKNIKTIKGEDIIKSTKCLHPLAQCDDGYNFEIPILHADFVTTDQGSGIVHIAPSHGEDDFKICLANNIKADNTVDAEGKYTDIIPLYHGQAVITSEGKVGPANSLVIADLKSKKILLGQHKFKHDYPHSWRSKKPLIFRNTPQWFIALDDKNNIRAKALAALKTVKFIPKGGYERLSSMIALRPDWCVSRQRVWGVPIPIFISKKDRSILKDQDVLNRVFAEFRKKGADCWFNEGSKAYFLGEKYKAEDFDQVNDVVDVWFDSGSTHACLLEKDDSLAWPADLYLEGSDQHRGWFHSSLLEAVGTRGKAPFKSILTHGFTLDDNGRKMSKSLGNILDLDKALKTFGADIIRLWTASTNFTEDQKVGPKTLTQQSQYYRRIRNTLRWLLGVIDSETLDQSSVSFDDFPPLEQYMLHRLDTVAKDILTNAEDFALHRITRSIYDFCNLELSAFYFDIRKDLIYCGDVKSSDRTSAIIVMRKIFSYLVRWLAPITPFTAEEAWTTAYGDSDDISVHLEALPTIANDETYIDKDLEQDWNKIIEVRNAVLVELEKSRQSGDIAGSLEAEVTANIPADTVKILKLDEWAEICIVSKLTLNDRQAHDSSAINVEVIKSSDEKCPRCWRYQPEVKDKGICSRCSKLVK